MAFEGFPDDGLVFYEGLEADNSKTYWTRHKAAYDTFVRGPLQALLEEIAPEFGTPKVFRPYRDVRFSHDKTPYKTHQGAVVHPDGAGAGSWYIQISAEGLMVSGGCWRSSPIRLPVTAGPSPTPCRARVCSPKWTAWPRATGAST